MKRQDQKELAKSYYIMALHEANTAKRAYDNALNDGIEGLRKLAFRDDWKEKTSAAKTLFNVFRKLEILTNKELEDIEKDMKEIYKGGKFRPISTKKGGTYCALI